MDKALSYHRPVMVDEVLSGLQSRGEGLYVDCTVGEGGHSLAIIENSDPKSRLLGIDADPEAIETAQRRLFDHNDKVILVNTNFSHLSEAVLAHHNHQAQGILLDLGLSSLQLDGELRGFSFQTDSPLDMRFDPKQDLTAAQIVNSYAESELVTLLQQLGEEPQARRITRALIQSRPLLTTRHLASVIEAVVPRRGKRLHPATKVFQALRIAVNGELENLTLVLQQAIDTLANTGRLVIISYHSLEDRIVKRFFQRESKDCLCPTEILICQCKHQAKIRVITKRVITPSRQEIKENPRSRSARLRIAERI